MDTLRLPGRDGADTSVVLPLGWRLKRTGLVLRGDRFWNPGMEIWVRAVDFRTRLHDDVQEFYCVIERCNDTA